MIKISLKRHPSLYAGLIEHFHKKALKVPPDGIPDPIWRDIQRPLIDMTYTKRPPSEYPRSQFWHHSVDLGVREYQKFETFARQCGTGISRRIYPRTLCFIDRKGRRCCLFEVFHPKDFRLDLSLLPHLESIETYQTDKEYVRIRGGFWSYEYYWFYGHRQNDGPNHFMVIRLHFVSTRK